MTWTHRLPEFSERRALVERSQFGPIVNLLFKHGPTLQFHERSVALATGGMESELLAAIEAHTAFKEFRHLQGSKDEAEHDLASLEREHARAEIDLQEIIGSRELRGARQASAIASKETEIADLQSRIASCGRGIAVLGRQMSKARESVQSEIDQRLRGIVDSRLQSIYRQRDGLLAALPGKIADDLAEIVSLDSAPWLLQTLPASIAKRVLDQLPEPPATADDGEPVEHSEALATA